MKKAIVVGSINMDVVAFVKKHPKLGETVFGNEVRYFPGGKGSNQAVACRRLGCQTQMIGRIGDDPFGKQMLAFQQQEGIDTSGVRQVKNHATGTAFITVSESGENSIIVISGANSRWDDGFADDLHIDVDDILLAQFETPNDAVRKAFKKARDCGATTILNPAPVRTIDPDIAKLTSLIVVNEHELAELSGFPIDVDSDESIFSAIDRLMKDGYRSVIVTLGGNGVRLLNAGKKHRVAARPVVPVDTTGAGDTFIGGLVAGLLSGLDMIQAAEFGNIAASLSVTRPGAAASIPTLTEVNRILNPS